MVIGLVLEIPNVYLTSNFHVKIFALRDLWVVYIKHIFSAGIMLKSINTGLIMTRNS